MKQIRDMIARRRPAGPNGTEEQQTSLIPSDEPLVLVSQQPANQPLGLVGDLDAAESEAEPSQEKALLAAREARDAVPRYSSSPPKISDGRPTRMMSESLPLTSPKPLPTAQVKTTPKAAPDEPKRKIWDMDLDADGRSTEDVLASAFAKSVMPEVSAEEAPASVSPSTPIPAVDPVTPEAPRQQAAMPKEQPTPAVSGGRIKTRLLGFHAEDLNQNMFEEPATPAAQLDTRFPIGWVVVVDGPGRGAAFGLTSGLSKIGRSGDQTVALDFGDSSISRDNHAAIAFDEEENAAYIGHGGKSNIVRLNGKPLLTTEELQNADLIRIGKTTLRFVALCGPDFRWTNTGDAETPNADHE